MALSLSVAENSNIDLELMFWKTRKVFTAKIFYVPQSASKNEITYLRWLQRGSRWPTTKTTAWSMPGTGRIVSSPTPYPVERTGSIIFSACRGKTKIRGYLPAGLRTLFSYTTPGNCGFLGWHRTFYINRSWWWFFCVIDQ